MAAFSLLPGKLASIRKVLKTYQHETGAHPMLYTGSLTTVGKGVPFSLEWDPGLFNAGLDVCW